MKTKGYNSNCSKCPRCSVWNRWDLGIAHQRDDQLLLWNEKQEKWEFYDRSSQEMYEVQQCENCELIVKLYQRRVPINYYGEDRILIQSHKWIVPEQAINVVRI